MKTIYEVVIEFDTPPFRRRETFRVESLREVVELRTLAPDNQFRVISEARVDVLDARSVADAIFNEKRATAIAIGEGPRTLADRTADHKAAGFVPGKGVVRVTAGA